MDIYSNAVPSSLPEYLFPGENTMEGGDGSVSLEWLSTFVEECLNGGGFTAQPPPPPIPAATTNAASKPITLASPITTTATKKTRSKRRKVDPDSPLVPQAYWLAESELIVLPRKEEVEAEAEVEMGRRCTHCMSQKTPQWRAGPMGPKTLCNACGVRFKSGRLLPEYRPAKSPTFQTYKHSNSHKRVMEMRSSSSSGDAN